MAKQPGEPSSHYPEVYFRQAIYIAYIDNMLAQLREHFASPPVSAFNVCFQ